MNRQTRYPQEMRERAVLTWLRELIHLGSPYSHRKISARVKANFSYISPPKQSPIPL